MNLYFRILLTLVANLFRRVRCNMTDRIVWKGRVLLNDIDVFGHMNNGRYLTLIGLALFDAGMKSGHFIDTLKYKYVYLFSHTDIQWFRPLHLFEKFSIQTQLHYWHGNKAYIDIRFINSKNQLAAKANYKVVIKSPIRKNVEWRDLVGSDIAPMRKPEIVEWLDRSA